MKRIILLLLASSLMLFPLLTSCSEKQTASSADTDQTLNLSDETAASADTVAQYAPLPSRDAGGNDFSILIRSEWAYEFDVGEQNGDIVNDAVFTRNTNTAEKYNVNLKFISSPGDWANHGAFEKLITSSVLAGDGEYDLIAGYQACLVINISNGEFLNILDLPYLELEAPWWLQVGLENLTFNGKCFMVTGDIALSALEEIFCMFFNKGLARNYNTPDLYAAVKDGGWTHAKLLEVIKDVTADKNGDGVMDANDLYGFVSSDTYVRPYVVAYDTPTLKLSDGSAEIIWNTERTYNVVESLIDLFYAQNARYAGAKDDVITAFRNELALIVPSMLGYASVLRGMDTDFGIIPYPKYDENQESYYTTTLNEATMMVVPITVKDPDLSAFLLEALCRESTDTVAHNFYNISLMTKMTRDDDSEEMIELIRSTLSFDFGWIHSMIAVVSGAQYSNMVRDKNSDFASWYASQEETITEKVKKLEAIYG